MATATPKKFAIQQIFELLLRRPSDKTIVAYLEDVKTSGLENTADITYPTGARGNVYIGRGFSYNKRATLTVETATWNTEVLAAQNGTELETGETEIVQKEVITVSATGTATTKYAPIGATGAEIGYAYLMGEDGSLTKEFQQATTAAQGKFTFSTATKTILFASADQALVAGNSIMIAYTRKTEDNAQRIAVSGQNIPDTVLATAYGLAADICSGVLYPCQIDGMAQIDPNWNFDVSADGEPAVQSLGLEFIKTCSSENLYTFTVYTDAVPV